MYEDRILSEELRSKIMSPEEAAALIKSGMTVAASCFGGGYPRAVTEVISKNHSAKDIYLIEAACRGEKLIDAWPREGVINRLSAFQFSDDCRKAINDGKVAFVESHLSQLAEKMRNGYYGKVDYAILEVTKVNADGSFVPGVAGGIIDTMAECAEKVILEVNLTLPLAFEGMHDMNIPKGTVFDDISEKKGSPYCQCDPDKIAAIVITKETAADIVFPPALPIHKKIAGYVIDLIRDEIAKGRLPENFTIKCGAGMVINSVLGEILNSGFKDLKMYTEVVCDQALDGILDGTITSASTTSLDLSGEGYQKVRDNAEFIKEHVAIRSTEFTNGAAPVHYCDLIAMNGALECDIYGNVNSSHAFGTDMINGIGGANDFCRNAKTSVFCTVSTSMKGALSRVVPMVSHVDNTEHDVDIIVTEWGIADLRGLSPKERVPLMINIAHPDYRQQLWDYYNGALEKCGPCQTPHDLSKAFEFYTRFEKTGTMKK